MYSFTQCPFNKNHKFAEEKYFSHISRCKDAPKVQHLYRRCRYQSLHILKKEELLEHEGSCASRQISQKFTDQLRQTYFSCRSQTKPGDVAKQLQKNTPNQSNIIKVTDQSRKQTVSYPQNDKFSETKLEKNQEWSEPIHSISTEATLQNSISNKCKHPQSQEEGEIKQKNVEQNMNNHSEVTSIKKQIINSIEPSINKTNEQVSTSRQSLPTKSKKNHRNSNNLKTSIENYNSVGFKMSKKKSYLEQELEICLEDCEECMEAIRFLQEDVGQIELKRRKSIFSYLARYQELEREGERMI